MRDQDLSWGISEVIKVAEQKARKIQQSLVISIFCDSQIAINNLREDHSSEGQALKMQVYQKTETAGTARTRHFHKVDSCQQQD